ncbi:MAG: hypothetical protein PF904_06945 [Kiritimatiellae bacterium]|nr:hypothetical protein [Kiritimatiellia bacterium]
MSSKDGVRAASDPLAGIKSSDRKKKFNWTADPWVVIGTVEYGGDRTMVSTVERVILDADVSQYPGFEKRLLKVATSKSCTECGYGFICRLLGLIGSDVSVDALKDNLLSKSESICHMSRVVIENVGSAKALAALKAAQPQVKGREKIGIAGAIKQMS